MTQCSMSTCGQSTSTHKALQASQRKHLCKQLGLEEAMPLALELRMEQKGAKYSRDISVWTTGDSRSVTLAASPPSEGGS